MSSRAHPDTADLLRTTVEAFSQDEIAPRGWALECRITSEDPANGFLPSTGRVQYLHVPAGPGVRWDGGIETGSEITLHYDPMLAKLIVHAPTRDRAIARMQRALSELRIVGIETSAPFHRRVLAEPDFRAGDIDTRYLEEHPQLLERTPDEERVRAAALAGVFPAPGCPIAQWIL